MPNIALELLTIRFKLIVTLPLMLLFLGCVGQGEGDDITAKPAYDVDLYRTKGGIPHIIASDWGSLGFGTGYAAGQDHFCAQSRNILKFRGELAANFGPGDGNLASDFFFKLLAREGIYNETIDSEFEHLFAGYAAGFNRYLRDTGIDKVTDPVCGGASWVTPMTADDVKRFHLTPAFLTSFAPLIMAAKPPAAVAKAFPAAGAESLVGVESDRIAGLAAYADSFYNPRDKGSNGVAIGRELTADKAGLLFANPHLNWQDFDFRMYAMHQIIPGVSNLLGANQAQRAHVGFGTNGDVAWTHTVSTSKTYMLYQLSLVSGDPLAYHYDDEQRKIEPVIVTAEVKGGDGLLTTRAHTFYKTGKGYMVGGRFPWNQSRAVSLRLASEGARGFQGGILAMERAQNVADLKAAVNRYQSTPGVNTIAVDSHGEVFYGDLGPMINFTDHQMKRCQLHGGPLYRGDTSSCAWNTDSDSAARGLLGARQQAALIRSDYVTNSNDSYWLANPAAAISGVRQIQGGHHSERTLRTRSGLSMIAERSKAGSFTQQSLAETLLDNQNYAGQLLRDDIVKLCRISPQVIVQGREVDLSEACGVLAAWDLHSNLTSRGAHLFREFMRAANDGKFTRWLPKAFNYRQPFDPLDPVNTPRGLDLTDNPAVLQALAKAVLVIDRAGIALDAKLGDIQSVTRRGERIAMHGGEEFEGVFNKMSYDPISTAGYPDVTGSSASWVMTTKLTPATTTVKGVLSYSESSDISSRHYSDMTKMFANKQLIDIPFTIEEVKLAALSELHLSEGIAQCEGDGWKFFAAERAACRRQFEALSANRLSGR